MAMMVDQKPKNIRLPLERKTFNPSYITRAVLIFCNESGTRISTKDIGSICYTRRSTSARKAFRTLKVDTDTLVPSRIKEVVRCIKLSAQYIDNGESPSTVYERLSNFLLFMDWVDENTLADVLTSKPDTHRAASLYVEKLWEDSRLQKISLNTAAARRRNLVTFLTDFFVDEQFSRGIRFIASDFNATESTSPPSEAAQGKVLALYEAIFTGFSSLVLDEERFPYSLPLPSYLNLPNNQLWIFPTTTWCLNPSNAADRANWPFPAWAIDYEEGRILWKKELAALLKEKGITTGVGSQRSSIRATLDSANRAKYGFHRKRFARLAMHAFIGLFCGKTGANWEQIINLDWSDEWEISRPRQLFRAIKWRANGKIVTFELPVQFLPLFKLFLKLRIYLLNELKCDRLFFSLGTRRAATPDIFRSNLYAITNIFRRIDPALPHITAKEWRAAKSDWLLRVTDIDTASSTLQNSPATMRKAYAQGSEERHKDEVSEVLTRISDKVKAGDSLASPMQIVTGGCERYGAPEQVNRPGGPRNKCRPDEGCLFCDNHRVHADDVDVRKLASCKHVLVKTAPMLGGIGGSEIALKPYIDRIDELLTEVSKHDATLVPRITHEVEVQGELTIFWARKLQMLTNLGIFE